MCHPGLLQGRWYVKRGPLAVERVSPQAAMIEIPAAVAGATGGDGESRSAPSRSPSTSPNKCVCSPTRHPGSFRCRQHHTEYEWVRRIRPKLRAPKNLSSSLYMHS